MITLSKYEIERRRQDVVQRAEEAERIQKNLGDVRKERQAHRVRAERQAAKKAKRQVVKERHGKGENEGYKVINGKRHFWWRGHWRLW